MCFSGGFQWWINSRAQFDKRYLLWFATHLSVFLTHARWFRVVCVLFGAGVCTRVYLFTCSRWKGKAAFGCSNWNPIWNWKTLSSNSPPVKRFNFYSLISMKSGCKHALRVRHTKQHSCVSFSLVFRNFRPFRAWAAPDSQLVTVAHRAFPRPPLRPPANHSQTSEPCLGVRMQQQMTRKRIHPTRSWIAIPLVALTRGLALLDAMWTINAPYGRLIAGHRGTFSSWGESWIWSRLKETEQFFGDFDRLSVQF